MELGVEDLSDHQRADPVGKVVRRRDGAAGSRRVGRILVRVVDGQQCCAAGRGRQISGVRIVGEGVATPAIHVTMRKGLRHSHIVGSRQQCAAEAERTEQPVPELVPQRSAERRHHPDFTRPGHYPAAMSLVTYELDNHIATITLNRPESRNAINGALRDELNAAWERFRADEDAWVGILTANGDVYCAGGDLKDGAGSVGTFAGTFWEKPTINSFESGMELFKPTIAAVHGPCVGYGVTGVLFCDFVIASTTATFSFPEVKLGVPTIVGAIRLPQRIGWANAMELLLTGEPVDAHRAKEIGLVWRLVEPEALQAEARGWAQTLTRAAPLAQRATKEVAWRTADMGWIESVRFGEVMRKVAGATEDVGEGLQAWRDKRPPQWRGR